MPTEEPILIQVPAAEARWLATALTVFGRLLDQIAMETPEGEVYRQEGLQALRSLAERLPTSVHGYYPTFRVGSRRADLLRRITDN
jgi:hypothetical protein